MGCGTERHHTKGADGKLAKLKIPADLLQIGAPIPFDIYGLDGRLLLRRGHVIESDLQLARLIQTGLYDPVINPGSVEAHRRGTSDRSGRVVREFGPLPSSLLRNKVSVFERLNEASISLDGLFLLDAPAAEFAHGVRSAVASVRECCALDSDAALAQILVSEPLRYSSRHPSSVAILAAHLLSRLRHDEARAAAAVAAALTMNLSVVELQDALYRQQGPLSSEQRDTLRLHPAASAQALRRHGIDDPVWLQTVEQHHEARDGSGYPAGLKGDAICREAQVVSLADRYCALVSERAYRPALSPRKAIKELHERNINAIDAALIGSLISAIGLFPPGAYVRLANGETAVVVRRLIDPKHPVVFALHRDSGAPYDSPKKRLTASHRDFEIIADVKPTAVRVKIDPETLWPPTATGEAPKANS
jgi:HD-GYP domain-containing protein (c-di-GMP phosphodiesterase class II)